MEKQDIIDNNKLIAEFMELEKSDNVYRKVEYINNEKIVSNFLHPVNMRYYFSWDWLMPVIIKIASNSEYDTKFHGQFDNFYIELHFAIIPH